MKTDDLTMADPARDLEPVLGDELRRARIEAIVAEAPEPDRAPARARRRPVLRIAAVAATAAVALTAATLVVRSDDSPGTAAAFAAPFQQREGIVHYVEGATRIDGFETDGSDPIEAWVALDGSGWRQRRPQGDGQYLEDTMDARGDQLRFASKTGRLRSFPAERPLPLEQRLGALNAGNYLSDLITGGELRDAGEATVDGQAVRRLVLDGPNQTRYDYLVTKDGERLLRIEAVNYNPYHPEAPPSRMERNIATFEILPDTPENRALVRMPQR